MRRRRYVAPTGFVAKRRGNRRRYAIALGLGFSDDLLRLMARVWTTATVTVGPDDGDVRTFAQAFALLPNGGAAFVAPSHREPVFAADWASVL